MYLKLCFVYTISNIPTGIDYSLKQEDEKIRIKN